MSQGRPRSAECDRAIIEAALAEYAERGFDGLSVDAVAARAGVGKATIYRRYPSKSEMVIAAAYEVAEELAPKVEVGSLRDDLVAGCVKLGRLMNHEVLGRVMRQIVADAPRHPDLAAMHESFVKARRRGMFAVLQRGIDRGEIGPDVDFEAAADLIVGPLFYRHMVSRMPVDDTYVEAIVDSFLRAHAV